MTTDSYNVNYGQGPSQQPMYPGMQATAPPMPPMHPGMYQTQPAMQTTVIVNQNAPVKREFTSGLCGCFEDCDSCCFGFFCLPCYACSVASNMNECCCVPVLAGGLVAMRTKLRTMHNIRGSICEDFWCVVCCHPLVVCQMDREMKYVGLL